MKQFIEDCDKLHRVVQSCKTKEQISSAWKYYKLWEKKHWLYDLPMYARIRGTYTDGFITGYFQGWVNNQTTCDQI